MFNISRRAAEGRASSQRTPGTTTSIGRRPIAGS